MWTSSQGKMILSATRIAAAIDAMDAVFASWYCSAKNPIARFLNFSLARNG